VLKKPAPLTTAEREIVQQHPQYGYEVVKNVGFLARAAEIVRGSHEWYSGRGYPQGLRGDDIPLGSRIVAAAEAYDSMVNTQLYRKPVSAQDAVIELARCRGTQFDPKVVDALINVVPM
jgi:HD-GYP domain-containing protein (c-di-GMP phosphodiesterase class II)